MKQLFAAIVLVVTACSSGVTAPVPDDSTTVCGDEFCIDVPAGWIVENGGDYLSAAHEDDLEHTILTVAMIDREAIVVASGGSWPATTAEVSRAFWALLEQAEVGGFGRSTRMVGGAERSWGTHEDGQMWHLVLPTGATRAIGVEIRAPNDSWESHADAVFLSVRPR
jgi:hypothetical protein